jgi:PHP family Zn ribbon phosphoesterase
MLINISDAVDNLGVINQRIAELEASARKIKQELIARGAGKYEGAIYIAEVQHYDRAQINPKLVREMVSPDIVSAVTEIKSVDAVVVKHL